MAAFDTTRPYVGARRGSDVFSRIISTIASWNDARVTRKELSKLTSRELYDIGLQQSDIDLIASGRN